MELVGSYIINGQTKRSDMDLLYIIQDDKGESGRIETSFADITASMMRKSKSKPNFKKNGLNI